MKSVGVVTNNIGRFLQGSCIIKLYKTLSMETIDLCLRLLYVHQECVLKFFLCLHQSILPKHAAIAKPNDEEMLNTLSSLQYRLARNDLNK